jgi:hypothetical protein
MERRSVFYYLILSVLALFVFLVSARKPFAATGLMPDRTPGCPTALIRSGKIPVTGAIASKFRRRGPVTEVTWLS